MDQESFWKNFHLGTELDVAGSFIFNGLRRLHEVDTFYYESDVFEILYNLSVGIERLLKVAVVLIEHDNALDQEEFENTLITHSHCDLIDRIDAKYALNLASPHNAFVALLAKFYKSHRYGRYSLASHLDADKQAFHRFLEESLGITIADSFPFDITPNSDRIRRLVGKRVGTLATKVYKVVRDEADRLGIYTYEIRPFSKAEKIFIRKKFDFIDEEVLWRELMLYFINSTDEPGVIKFMKSIRPLPFDPGLAGEYLQSFSSDEGMLRQIDELEHLYADVDDVKHRLELLKVIGDPNVVFDGDNDCDEWDDDDTPSPD